VETTRSASDDRNVQHLMCPAASRSRAGRVHYRACRAGHGAGTHIRTFSLALPIDRET
jgi:hypothetical protein